MFWAVRVRITWDVCVADIEAWNLLQALFFKTGNHVFTPSRWTKNSSGYAAMGSRPDDPRRNEGGLLEQ